MSHAGADILDTRRDQTGPVCNICGGTVFVPGPAGRMAAKGRLAPRCADCGALERHRIVRQVYDALPDEMLSGARALQFSQDPSAPKERFGSVEESVFGIANSLDMAAIDRPDESYDWVIANHVLEHVQDDHSAMRELLRIVTGTGIVQLTVPAPSAVLETWELGAPDPGGFGHWRGYGSDLPQRFTAELAGKFGVQIVARDDATGRWDVVYLFTKSRKTMLTAGDALIAAGLPTLRCA